MESTNVRVTPNLTKVSRLRTLWSWMKDNRQGLAAISGGTLLAGTGLYYLRHPNKLPAFLRW